MPNLHVLGLVLALQLVDPFLQELDLLDVVHMDLLLQHDRVFRHLIGVLRVCLIET